MPKTIVVLACLGAAVWSAPAQIDSRHRPTINVSSTGKVTAKPDLAVVFLATRSSSPLAADALEQNRQKVKEIKARLAALGYGEGQVRFTSNRFAPSGQGVYYPGGQRPTGFDVYCNVYVRLDAADLKDVNQFNARISTLLDELGKMGASPATMPISSMSMGGASVVAFAVKDASVHEKAAYVQALEKSRPIAEDIARRMKVQITGIDSVSSAAVGRGGIIGGPANPLEEIPYEYFSSSMDEVPVRVRLDVRYAFK